jgi:predicted small secreted protein|tara:strand:- start:273 stop:446 length:174 start_codon:yes stop_codon:yes gene_type:complete
VNEKNVKMVSCLAVLVIGLTGCGNTINGFGKDISDVGTKVTDWQNKPAKVEVEKKVD